MSLPQRTQRTFTLSELAMLWTRSGELHGRGVNLVVVSIIFTVAAICLVAARLAARYSTGRKFGWDDYAIVLSSVSPLLNTNQLQHRQ